MAEMNETIVITGSQEATEAIRQVLDAESGSESFLGQSKTLTADIAVWTLIANVAVTVLPKVLDLLKDARQGRQVKSLKYDGVEIENPRREDIERFEEWITSRAKQASETEEGTG